MKKKISVFALILLILPLLALFGCGSKDSFYVSVESSWTGLIAGTLGGTVSGSGNYTEEKSVTLTATAKPDSTFIAWVYEDSLLITGNKTYTVDNNRDSSNKITKSTLKFKSGSKTKGRYTAVFADNKIAYTMLTSWRITDDLDAPAEENNVSTTPVTMSANLYIKQGNSNYDVYSGVNYEVKNNVINHTNVNEVFKLNPHEPQELYVDLTINEDLANFSKLMTASIPFAETTEFVNGEDNTYSYKTIYNKKGTYEVVFKFNFNSSERFLVIEYSNLTVDLVFPK